MDSRDNFLKNMKYYISKLDDEYLIGITSKGIFNRAVKDLENTYELNIEIDEKYIKVTLPDNNVCLINENIKEYKCTCPSRTVCKHLIMSYLYLKNYFKSTILDNVEKSDEAMLEVVHDYSHILNLKIEELREAISERSFEEIIKRIRFGIKTEIEEGSLLIIRFINEENIVKYMSNNNELTTNEILRDGICSCKSREICRHRIEAVIHYQMSKGLYDVRQLSSHSNIKLLENKHIYFEATYVVKKLTEEIMLTGLSRLPPTISEELEAAAIRCHNNGIPNMERDLRRVKAEIDLYLKKSATFSKKILREKLSGLYGTALSIENCNDKDKLIKLCGEIKSIYYDVPPITLTGIGAEVWSSKSGYEGITYYFYDGDRNKIFTYTNSRPIFYRAEDDKKTRNFRNSFTTSPYQSPWGIDDGKEEISKCIIKLVDAKVNDEGRISGSIQSKGTIIGRTNLHETNVQSLIIDNWEELISKYEGRSNMSINPMEDNDLKEEQKGNVFLIRPKDFGKGNFDNISQTFTLPIYDLKDRSIDIGLSFSEERKVLIQKLERMERLERYPDSLLGTLYILEGKLILIPLVAYYEDGRIVNLTIE